MEFREVVRRRRMVRSYDGRPVPHEIVDRMLDHATRAPSAGFSQGWAFLVLDTPEDVGRFWTATTPPERAVSPSRWLRGMRTAPVVIVPLAHKAAYLDRYAEPDKGWTDRDELRWAAPYWFVDTGMASLLILLTAVDEGLGACFFGIPPARIGTLRSSFGIPEDYDPVGAITVGYRASEDVEGSRARGRRPLPEVVHRGRWQRPDEPIP
ncbi:nitroreductase family protein [Mumia zhuanghuii]|uniref:Nitroreductase family protein n=1 Tax=Mumia zhuanghuii TaxID=2585211 RepID=A0A5C4MSJ0_9ACTN|nr:nitroreductase family protein [Mumia zhuanghuii]TNC47066.1 nitroreductase family protein [Mumia zhuanghuii]TNC50378.1 nitroreductase family protein [Mumia zhuanghuii]